jgi:transcriptional antiterminator NusG
MEEQIEIKDGKRKANLKKVFPGYVLIKMIVTEQSWYIVRNTRGVTSFVGSGTTPTPLTEEEKTNGTNSQQYLVPIVKGGNI